MWRWVDPKIGGHVQGYGSVQGFLSYFQTGFLLISLIFSFKVPRCFRSVGQFQQIGREHCNSNDRQLAKLSHNGGQYSTATGRAAADLCKILHIQTQWPKTSMAVYTGQCRAQSQIQGDG